MTEFGGAGGSEKGCGACRLWRWRLLLTLAGLAAIWSLELF